MNSTGNLATSCDDASSPPSRVGVTHSGRTDDDDDDDCDNDDNNDEEEEAEEEGMDDVWA